MTYKDRKEIYEIKQLAAERQRQLDAEVGQANGLTEEQTDALESLCQFRHQWHSNMEHFFCEESTWHAEAIRTLFEWVDNGGIIAEGLPKIHLSVDYTDIDDNGTAYLAGYDNLDDNDQYDEWYNHCYDQYEQINDDIEKYLAEIDKKYGTSYCPTGLSRFDNKIISEKFDFDTKTRSVEMLKQENNNCNKTNTFHR